MHRARHQLTLAATAALVVLARTPCCKAVTASPSSSTASRPAVEPDARKRLEGAFWRKGWSSTPIAFFAEERLAWLARLAQPL